MNHNGGRGVGKREAQRLLNEMVAERGLEARTTTTVGDLLGRWFEAASNDFSPKTVREVSGFIERNLRPALGDVRLTKLNAASLDRYYQRLLKDGGRGGRPLAPSTIRRIHGILRRALAQGVRWGWLGVNPAASATPQRVQSPDVKPPTPDEVGRLQAAIAEFSEAYADQNERDYDALVHARRMVESLSNEISEPSVALRRGGSRS